MRFILGLLIGVGIGFAASVLLSPGKGETVAVRGTDDRANGAGSTLGGLRKQFDEAMGEAKKAQREAEEKMNERYRQIVGRSDK